MTEEEKAKDLLKKYADQELDPAGVKKVEEWYASLEHSTTRIGNSRKAEMKADMFAGLQKAMAVSPERKVLKLAALLRMSGIAAAIFVVAAMGIALWQPAGKAPARAELFSVTTGAGQTKKLTLADGSEIWLNPSSCLSYAKDFSHTNRTVELTEGEAFFKIAHEEKRPFLVKTSDSITTTVLGTSFRIKSYKARRSIDVLVATGKVAVGNSRQEFATLIKGQQIAFDKENQRAEVTYMPVPIEVKLVFDGITLREALRELEYAYSIRIELENQSIAELKCKATFNTRQQAEEILDILCSLHHLKFKAADDHKTFKIDKI
ncbi:FecR family protein [Pedobacter sp. AW31-3R]|uniref:FecR family protein n=1 Tax=Pedobacter sp. AW31-3R TaxID=3445781 RepID=UPI003FA14F60